MATKKPVVHAVTDEHAQQFAGCVIYWADVLGLNDWRITVSAKRASSKVMAEVYKCDLEQRSATIRLGKDFGTMEVTERNLSDLALHECLHIFLREFREFLEAGATEEDSMSAEHRCINVLERVLSNASPLGPSA
jgi:hypothetical protein